MTATYDVTFLLRNLPNFSFNSEDKCLSVVDAAPTYLVLLIEINGSARQAVFAQVFF